MTDFDRISAQVRRVAWGYFFLFLDFNLNSISILPDFIGWILFCSAIQGLKEEQPKLALLEHFAVALGLWSVVGWLPLELPNWLALPQLVFRLMELYFHFQLLTELAQLAGRYQELMDRKDHAQCILWVRTGTTVVQTVLVLMVAAPISEDILTAAAVVMLLFQVGLCFYTMGELFSLANGLKRLGLSQ